MLVCDNNASIYYRKSMDYIKEEMKKTNYDFDSWCVRAPAMWTEVVEVVKVVEIVKVVKVVEVVEDQPVVEAIPVG